MGKGTFPQVKQRTGIIIFLLGSLQSSASQDVFLLCPASVSCLLSQTQRPSVLWAQHKKKGMGQIINVDAGFSHFKPKIISLPDTIAKLIFIRLQNFKKKKLIFKCTSLFVDKKNSTSLANSFVLVQIP